MFAYQQAKVPAACNRFTASQQPAGINIRDLEVGVRELGRLQAGAFEDGSGFVSKFLQNRSYAHQWTDADECLGMVVVVPCPFPAVWCCFHSWLSLVSTCRKVSDNCLKMTMRCRGNRFTRLPILSRVYKLSSFQRRWRWKRLFMEQDSHIRQCSVGITQGVQG